jgi:phospholipase C
MRKFAVAAALVAVTVAGSPAYAAAPTMRAFAGPIQHVVFIIQENRSFDNLFHGYPGAHTASYGMDSKGQRVRLVPIPFEVAYDVDHDFPTFMSAWDGGKMDGFDLEPVGGDHRQYKHPQYGFVPHSETTLYFAMAHQYVLGDNMFTSHIDASYISHQYAIAAQADRAVDFPSEYFGCDGQRTNTIETVTDARQLGPTENTCRNYQTLGDELDGAGLSWRYYTYSNEDWIWDPYASVQHIYKGPDWKNVIAPETQIFSDIQSGSLANVAWVTPSDQNSDHSGSGSKLGPQWVASVVNAIGESKYWDSTAIFVMWDEWGGWYDDVPPPTLDYDGLGIRVPLLAISPYAKRGYVSHVQFETASVLRFIEDQYGLGQLAASDARANDPAADCFDFTRKPRTFAPFKTDLKPRDFVRLDGVRRVVPDSE